jgi:NitT/TauT family transport system substrate-binding protein
VSRLILAVALCAVASRGPAAELRVGVMPITGTLPFFAALEAGDFTAHGLDVEMTTLSSGARILEAVAGGSLDVGECDALSALQAIQAGLDLMIVAPGAFVREDTLAVNGLVVLAQGPIRSALELRGKRIAVNSLNAVNYAMTAEFLSRAGVASREVTWLELGFPQMPLALEMGRVDAVSVTEPFLTVMRDRGTVRLLSPAQDVIAGAPIGVYVTRREQYLGRKAVMAAFAMALAAGVERCNTDPAAARRLLPKYTGIAVDLADRVGLHLFRAHLQANELETIEKLARRHGLLDSSLDLRGVVLSPPTRP